MRFSDVSRLLVPEGVWCNVWRVASMEKGHESWTCGVCVMSADGVKMFITICCKGMVFYLEQ